uniref:Biphenyl hydrolase like n=1 Tax=Capra hircus TaxID=9925 RepID=A0A8C2SHA5_CAPHI
MTKGRGGCWGWLARQLSRPLGSGLLSCSSSVTSAKAEVNGVHLHYLRTGDGEHAVLLLPGMLGSGETDFGPQIEKLNKKLFTVVAWDPRGYGHSRPPDRDFPVDFFERDAKDAVDLMKTLKFKKVSLLGWSDGGITALIAAARYPSYVSKMVIWGANAYVTEQDTEIYQGIRDVSKWSERTRKPLEALYGFDYFARTCEKWVDGIEQFKHLPDGGWKDKPQAGVTVSRRTGARGLWGLRSPTWDGTALQWRRRVLTSGPSGKSLQNTLKSEQEHLSGPAPPGPVSHLNCARREGSPGPTFPCRLLTQTCERVTVPSDAGRQAQPAPTLRRRIQQAGGRLPPVTMSQDAWSGEVWACGPALRSAACQAPCASPDCSSCSTAEDIASSFIAAELESDLFILGFSSIALNKSRRDLLYFQVRVSVCRVRDCCS